MMTLELEYFFLCSEPGDTSHSPPRAGPTALRPVGTGPTREGGVKRRGGCSVDLLATRKDVGVKSGPAGSPFPPSREAPLEKDAARRRRACLEWGLGNLCWGDRRGVAAMLLPTLRAASFTIPALPGLLAFQTRHLVQSHKGRGHLARERVGSCLGKGRVGESRGWPGSPPGADSWRLILPEPPCDQVAARSAAESILMLPELLVKASPLTAVGEGIQRPGAFRRLMRVQRPPWAPRDPLGQARHSCGAGAAVPGLDAAPISPL